MSQHILSIKPAQMYLDGETWVPLSYAAALKDQLTEKQRSAASHGHQFAIINDLWHNLPHSHAGAPYAANAEHFRKHGLIQAGYCDVDTVVFESQEAAIAAAPFIAKIARKGYGYALTIVSGNLVVCRTPHSQSYKAMGKDLFHESKQAVIEWGESLLGVAR
jgi:hypothetical protein